MRTVQILCVALAVMLTAASGAPAQSSGPFDKYLGRWVGEGRLGMREGATEQVKCRVTYTRGTSERSVKQSIRCAAASGSIEVQSEVAENGGVLTGTWVERMHDLKGDIAGTAGESGLRIRVRSQGFSANMSIALREERQIIEIQFLDGVLIGLTLGLTRG